MIVYDILMWTIPVGARDTYHYSPPDEMPETAPAGMTRLYELDADGFQGTMQQFEDAFGGVGGTLGGVVSACLSSKLAQRLRVLDIRSEKETPCT